MTFKWIIEQKTKLLDSLIDLAKGDTLLARLLLNRGVDSIDTAKYFLALDTVLPSPANEIPGLDKAFERIRQAIEHQEKILIYGDYDVDGTSSVALLYRAFQMIGITVAYYIPSREHEGYGLNNQAIHKIRTELNIDLMITCDCGISNYDEIAYANSIGLEVIVTDHHSIPEQSPPSIANCNPKTLEAQHPLHYLPGVGVAYKLAELILEEFIQDKIEAKAYASSLLDLVALGMIADMAPLKAENRYLTNIGLEVLAKSNKPGLVELLKICGSKNSVDTENIGFGLAPRINAAGRLADAARAVRLMITEDELEAQELCRDLDEENRRRQILCEEIFNEALTFIDENTLNEHKCIAIASESWHHGVIGIVASRLLDKFHVPVFIMSIEKDVTKGSVRSIHLDGDLDIFAEMQAIQRQHNLFAKYGGHRLAAGFSCKKADTQALITAIQKHFKTRLANQDLRKIIKIDTAVKLSEMNFEFIDRLSRLSPYGIEHPQAIFVAGPLKVQAMRLLGAEGKHLKLYLQEESNNAGLMQSTHRTTALGLGQGVCEGATGVYSSVNEDSERANNAEISQVRKSYNGKQYEAVVWNRGQEFLDSYHRSSGASITIAFTPKINTFNNTKQIQLEIRDWKDPKDVDPVFFVRFSARTVSAV